MWMLRHLNSDLRFYLKPEKKEYAIGRNTGFLLGNDKTISRHHASLFLKASKLFVVDEESRYKTYVNDGIEKKTEIVAKKQVELKKGDRIRFGQQSSEFVVDTVNICTLSSTLTPEVKTGLVEYLKKIGGKVVDVPDETCTHLTMSKIVITAKQLQALVMGLPIVTVEYWSDVMKAINLHKPIPDVKKYLPENGEDFLRPSHHLFHVNPNRKTLLQGKNVYFFSSRHLRQYKETIETAGGKAFALDQKQNKVKKPQLVANNALLIQYDASAHSQSTQSMDTVANYVRSKGLRLIPETEIQLAILHCSVEKYCNPQYKFNQNFAVLKPIKSDILARNTEPHHSEEPSEEVVVPESAPALSEVSENEPSTSRERGRPQKRKLEEQVEESNKVVVVEDVNDAPGRRRSTRANPKRKNEEPAVEVAPMVNEAEQEESHIVPVEIPKSPPQIENDIPMVEIHLETGQVLKNTLSSDSFCSSIFGKENGDVSNIPSNEVTQSRRTRRRDSDDNEESGIVFGNANKRQKTLNTPVSHVSRIAASKNDTMVTDNFKKPTSTPIATTQSQPKNSPSETSITYEPQNTRNDSTSSNTSRSSSISIKGWLCKSQTPIKCDPDKENVPKPKEFTEYEQKSANFFIAEVIPNMIVIREDKDATDGSIVDNGCMNESRGKNFKKFVKKNNYKKQTKLIKAEIVAAVANVQI